MKYSKEFKEEALKLSDEIGLKKAAQQLGIQYYTLSDWRSKRNAAVKAKKYQMTDAKEKHSMRFIYFRGLSQVSKWVRLKFATMNLKKYAIHRWIRGVYTLFFTIINSYCQITV